MADDPKLHQFMRQMLSDLGGAASVALVPIGDTRVVSVNDQPVQLTGKEYAILELLTVQKDTIVTREMLLNHLYGGRDEPELRIIDVFVCKLRKKLAQATGGEHYIETVWRRGYMLREPVATVATQTHVTMREVGLSDSLRR
jgi:two-component system, cell cycle response regulator CtrA